MDNRIVPDVMNDVLLPSGTSPENCVLISQMELCQDERVKKGGTWRMLRTPDQRHGQQGHRDNE